jgi:hypothetical protein
MKRWLAHPAVREAIPGAIALAVLVFGIWRGWGQ